eukprot:5865093-Prymnesium_polylepis.1
MLRRMDAQTVSPYALLVVAFVVLSGWRPQSRETSLAEVVLTEARTAPRQPPCMAWPYALADAVLLLRRQYVPVATGRQNRSHWPAPWGEREAAEARRCARGSAREVAALHEALARSGPVGSRHSTAVRVETQWSGRERALGPVLHSLVPLLWWAALTPHLLPDDLGADPVAVRGTTRSAGRQNSSRPPVWLLPPPLHVFAAGGECARARHALACFVQPAGGQLGWASDAPAGRRLKAAQHELCDGVRCYATASLAAAGTSSTPEAAVIEDPAAATSANVVHEGGNQSMGGVAESRLTGGGGARGKAAGTTRRSQRKRRAAGGERGGRVGPRSDGEGEVVPKKQRHRADRRREGNVTREGSVMRRREGNRSSVIRAVVRAAGRIAGRAHRPGRASGRARAISGAPTAADGASANLEGGRSSRSLWWTVVSPGGNASDAAAPPVDQVGDGSGGGGG